MAIITKNRKSGKRSFYQNIFFSILIGSFLFATIGFLSVSSWRMTQKRLEMSNRIGDLKEAIWTLEEKNRKLQDGLVDMENDSYWEERIREQGYKKEGERAVIVLPQEEEPEKIIEEEQGFWQDIFR